MANIVLNNMMGFISIPQVLQKIMMVRSYINLYFESLINTYKYTGLFLQQQVWRY